MEPPANHPETFDDLTASGPVRLSWVNHGDPSAVSLVEGFSGLSLVRIELPEEVPEAGNFPEAPTAGNLASDQQTLGVEGGAEIRCPVAPLTNTTPTPESTPLTQEETTQGNTQEKGKTQEKNTKGKARKSRGGAAAKSATAVLNGQSFPERARQALAQAANTPVKPRRWRDLTHGGKMLAAAEAAERAEGFAVTLNLSLDRAGRYMSNTLKSSIRDLFRDRLNKELKQAGIEDLAYALAFEISSEGRLHLHGVVSPGEDQDRKVIEEAMRRAGGQISGRARARQVKFKSITHAAGWAGYMAKARRETARQIGAAHEPIISQAMRKQAEKHHEEARRALIAA